MSKNITKHDFIVSRQRREKVNGHKGMVLWFTGLSGSGKSTIANNLDDKLNALGKRTYILDGDNVRLGLNNDLGFSGANSSNAFIVNYDGSRKSKKYFQRW